MTMGSSATETDDAFNDIGGPYVATFTGRIPFLLGVPDHLGHTLSLPHPFVDPEAAAAFGAHPKINIRVCKVSASGIPMRAPGADQALKRFYGYDLPEGLADRFAEDKLKEHEQWVTLETPGAIAELEDPADKAFAFHRCLAFFNHFIQAVMVATNDFRLRTVVAQDFRPAVVVGAITFADRKWRHVTDMMLFPEFPYQQAMLDKPSFNETQFQQGLELVRNNAPFVRALMWHGRASDALRRTGDAASAIVGLQTAAEALLFDTYRMLLVDEGRSLGEIEIELSTEPAFATLVKTLLKDRLGGQWDPTVASTAVGKYWEHLYQVRNDTVHRGFQPHLGQAEEARDAYVTLFEYVAERVRTKCRTYPRTLLALIGEEGLSGRGWLSSWMSKFADGVKAEPGIYFQPWDEAGREANQ